MARRAKAGTAEPLGENGLAASRASSQATLRVKLIKSAIGYSVRQKRTLKALGFRRLGQVVEQPDTPAIRGMVQKVIHLVEVIEA
jgi:large subunit ribosomal protein L30